MRVISEAGAVILWFDSPSDLDGTINSLHKLKEERAAKQTMSWPAFHAEAISQRVKPEGDEYTRSFLRWLRARLHKEDPSKFSD